MIFVAVPYTHADTNIVEQRCEVLTDYLGYLFSRGQHAVAPVAIGHPLTKGEYRLPGDYKFWRDYSRKMLPTCSEVHVLTLPGWAQSEGVKDEIYHAHFDLKLPVRYIQPQDPKWGPDYAKYVDVTDEINGEIEEE